MTAETLAVMLFFIAALVIEPMILFWFMDRRRTFVIRKDRDTGQEYIESLRPPRNNVEVGGEPDSEDVEQAGKPKEVLDFEEGFSKPGE